MGLDKIITKVETGYELTRCRSKTAISLYHGLYNVYPNYRFRFSHDEWSKFTELVPSIIALMTTYNEIEICPCRAEPWDSLRTLNCAECNHLGFHEL